MNLPPVLEIALMSFSSSFVSAKESSSDEEEEEEDPDFDIDETDEFGGVENKAAMFFEARRNKLSLVAEKNKRQERFGLN